MAINVTPSDVRDHYHLDLTTSDVSDATLNTYIRMAEHRREDVEAADSDDELSEERLEDIQLLLACHHLEAQFFRASSESGEASKVSYVDGPDYLDHAISLDKTGTIKPDGEGGTTPSVFEAIDATGTRD